MPRKESKAHGNRDEMLARFIGGCTHTLEIQSNGWNRNRKEKRPALPSPIPFETYFGRTESWARRLLLLHEVFILRLEDRLLSGATDGCDAHGQQEGPNCHAGADLN